MNVQEVLQKVSQAHQVGQEADLSNTDLRGMKFNTALFGIRRVDLHRTNFRGANLRGAKFYSSNLQDCDFRGADLDGSNLSRASLVGADLTGATLAGSNLERAELRGAKLVNTDLQRVNLRGADLSGADLSHANLICADVDYTNMTGAILVGANLTRIKVNDTPPILRGALYSEDTRWDKFSVPFGSFLTNLLAHLPLFLVPSSLRSPLDEIIQQEARKVKSTAIQQNSPPSSPPSMGRTIMIDDADLAPEVRTCTLCQKPILPDAVEPTRQLVACRECGSPYHLGCWQYNGDKCAIHGCNGTDVEAPTTTSTKGDKQIDTKWVVAIALVSLLCCLCATLTLLWFFGDHIFGLASEFADHVSYLILGVGAVSQAEYNAMIKQFIT
jgi:hypothetical protein